ncbi:MAG: LysR substrate-binding domain-containing protein [Pikeienuella sp.]
MEPTAIGGDLIGHARQMLILADNITAASSPGGERGHLRIGVIQTALTGLLPAILVRVRQRRPGVDIHLIPGASSELYAQVNRGELDAAIIVKPEFAKPKSLDWLPLRREHLLLVAPPGSRMTKPMRLLQREPFIRYDRNNWGGRIVERYLRRKRVQPREQFELDSLEAIVIMVSRGLGVSVIPDWPAPWPHGVALEKLILEDGPQREIGVIWSRSARRLPVLRSFLNEAGETGG